MRERGTPNLPKELREIKERYLEIFDNIDYMPTYEEIGGMLGISGNEVRLEISILGLTRVYRSIPYLIKLRSRLPIYKEYYFNVENSIGLFGLSKMLNITEKSVMDDIRYLTDYYGYKKSKANYMHSKNKEEIICISERAKGRKELYDIFIESVGYIPYLKDFVNHFNYSASEIKEDLDYLGYKTISCKDYGALKRKERLSKKLDFYKKYYFEAETPLSQLEMAKMQGVSATTVATDLFYIRQYFGLSLKDIVFEKKAIEQEKKDKEKEYNKNLREFVKENYFKSLYYMRGDDICKELGIDRRELHNIRNYILRTEDVFVRARYWDAKAIRYIGVPFDMRLLSYQMYNKAEGPIKDLRTLADSLRLPYEVVFSDFKSEVVIKEFGEIEIPELRVNTCPPEEVRLSMYEKSFMDGYVFTSVKKFASYLGLSEYIVLKDFRKYELKKKYKEKYLSMEVPKKKVRTSAFEQRKKFYLENFFNSKSSMTIIQLSDRLNIPIKEVRKDIEKIIKQNLSENLNK